MKLFERRHQDAFDIYNQVYQILVDIQSRQDHNHVLQILLLHLYMCIL